jgi:hypothetical protein
MQAESRTVRATLGRRRLLIALVLALLVPGALGLGALTYRAPEPAPTTTALRHPPLPQAPDSVALAQIDRSAAATRAAKTLTTPQLLTPARTETAQASTLPTLALAPRDTPYTLAELHRLVPAAFSDVPVAPGALLVDADIEVPEGATLVIDTQTPDVRLPSGSSGFATIISRGTTAVAGTAETPVRISSWDPQQQAPDAVASDGRAFVLQIGARMDIDHGQFEYLGFGTGTSSGVAWRGAAPDVAGTAADAAQVKAQGTVTNSLFVHNHFGAYTHEAQGMHWSGNTFSDIEEYGFDPHDFSDDFVVENNLATNNGKHGVTPCSSGPRLSRSTGLPRRSARRRGWRSGSSSSSGDRSPNASRRPAPSSSSCAQPALSASRGCSTNRPFGRTRPASCSTSRSWSPGSGHARTLWTNSQPSCGPGLRRRSPTSTARRRGRPRYGHLGCPAEERCRRLDGGLAEVSPVCSAGAVPVVVPGMATAARPGERCGRPCGYCSSHLQARRVCSTASRTSARLSYRGGWRACNLVGRDQVGPVHLRRGAQFPPLGRKALAGEDPPEALPHDHCGRADAGAAEPPRRPRCGVGDDPLSVARLSSVSKLSSWLTIR